jgi:hypothetical protein
LKPLWAQVEANNWGQFFGGGENGRKVAEFIMEVQHDLPPGTLTGRKPSDSLEPNPTESGPIQPNPTKNCVATTERIDL